MTRRILFGYLALTLVILAALEIPLAIGYRDRLTGELSAQLQRDAFAIASYAEETVEGTGNVDLQLLAANYGASSGARIIIVNDSGTPLADSNPVSESNNFSSREEVVGALAGQIKFGTRHSDTLKTDLLYVAVPIASGKVYGAVRLTFPASKIDEQVQHYWLNLAAVAAISLLAAAAIGIALARWVTRPLARLGEAATTFGRGDLDARAPVNAGPPEVRRLARSFNATAMRLTELISVQEQFVADASHQLRTPLAALQLRIENLQRENDAQQGLLREVGADDDFFAQDLDAAKAETQRLARLVDGLLSLARADRGDATATAELLFLPAILDERVLTWEAAAGKRGVHLDSQAFDLRVLATRDRLTQILDNLIANALDAAPRGTTVHLKASAKKGASDEVAIDVIDEGPGMTEAQREHAFDRFWRATQEAKQSAEMPADGDAEMFAPLGGSGLGLSIVRKLARADGGDVELFEAPGGGLDARVTLARNP